MTGGTGRQREQKGREIWEERIEEQEKGERRTSGVRNQATQPATEGGRGEGKNEGRKEGRKRPNFSFTIY